MKTYGKEPESLDSIVQVFANDLAEYPIGTILQAVSTHARRSDEFPTVYDLVSLIERNGKPPLRESDIIAIRKKDGEDRTDAEWRMLREWDAEQQNGWQTGVDSQKQQATIQENIRLRQQVKQQREEINRLSYLLKDARQGYLMPPIDSSPKPLGSLMPTATPAPTQQPTDQARHEKTLQWMRESNFSQMDFEDFLATQGVYESR